MISAAGPAANEAVESASGTATGPEAARAVHPPGAFAKRLRRRRRSRRGPMGRAPAVPAAIAFSLGILGDRLAPISGDWLVPLAVVLALNWLQWRSRQQAAAASLSVLLLCATAGAMRHHDFWHARRPDDVDRLVLPASQFVQVSGTVATRPEQLPDRSGVPYRDGESNERCRFVLEVAALPTDGETSPASGRLQVDVRGLLTGLKPGDGVLVTGMLRSFAAPNNPGQPDFTEALRRNGIRGRLSVSRPELVQVTAPNDSWLAIAREQLRQRCEAALRNAFSERTRPLALAMLLGNRSLVNNETQLDFVESGTMHLLAISGLHVGILTAFLFGCVRCGGLSGNRATLAVLFLLTVYLLIADTRPPMIRAYVLIAILGTGRVLRRPSLWSNSLAVAAIVLLVMNPTSLFDVGAQLSFLAVAALLWLASLDVLREAPLDVVADAEANPDVDREIARRALQTRWQRRIFKWGRELGRAWLMSATIWLLTFPLVADAFNVVSPVGLFVNVLLTPLVFVGLCSGFLSMLAGMLHPLLAIPCASVFELSLRCLLGAVDLASKFPFGHFYLSEIPGQWLAGYYLIAAAIMLTVRLGRRSFRLWIGLILWILFGISVALSRSPSPGVRCTFLSVGHGVSILVELPNGRVLVYDAGSLRNPEYATRTLERALWERGFLSIDALVISHADSDHYNGAESILRTFPVGHLFVSRHFPDASQPGTTALCQAAVEHGIPIQFVQSGDRLQLDGETQITVLHPSAERDYVSDNAASVVLEIEFAGRRILLTGDLEHDGLSELLTRLARPTDVLLAPHHGSQAANPRELAAWTQPKFVIASAGRRLNLQTLQATFGSTSQVISTSKSGAIRFTIQQDGAVALKTLGIGTELEPAD